MDTRANDKDRYATPSGFIRDLIRHDMEENAVLQDVLKGLDDVKHGRFSDESILDI